MGITGEQLAFGSCPVDAEDYTKIKNEFIKFGLTPNQIKIFFYLSKFGSKTAMEVSKNTEIPRTESYHILSSLQSKGIVFASYQHPIKFSATSLRKTIFLLFNVESERLNELEKTKPILEELWVKVPEITKRVDEITEQFQILRRTNQINNKIFDMISNTKNEFLLLGCEKNLLKFYHTDFLSALEKRSINYKLLTSVRQKSQYIFNDMDKSRIKALSSVIKENLCFLIKDDNELLFFIKNSFDNNKEVTAIWTNSETFVYSKQLLFRDLWTKSRSI